MAKKEKKVTNKENIKENKNKKSFFKGLRAELKKVIWPTPKQLVNNTIAVITIVLITTIIVFVLDFAFESLNRHGVDKIKEAIQSIEATTDENSTTDSTGANETSEGNTSTEENANNEANENTEVTDNTGSEETSTNQTDETQDSTQNSVE